MFKHKFRIVKCISLDRTIYYTVETRYFGFLWLFVEGSLSLSYEEAERKLNDYKNGVLPSREIIK